MRIKKPSPIIISIIAILVALLAGAFMLISNPDPCPDSFIMCRTKA